MTEYQKLVIYNGIITFERYCTFNNGFVFTSAQNEYGQTFEGGIEMAQIREGQQIVVTASPKTANGHAASIQTGTARWASSKPEIATVTVNANNELQATVKGVDGTKNEAVTITLRADGDQSDEVAEIVGTMSVVVTFGNATVFDLIAGAATTIPR